VKRPPNRKLLLAALALLVGAASAASHRPSAGFVDHGERVLMLKQMQFQGRS
jgi:hypothetical protein